MPGTPLIRLRPPFLIFLGDATDDTYAKTGFGLVHWRKDTVIGQLRFPGCSVDLGVPERTVAEAIRAGAGSLVLGVAPAGGRIPERWWSVIEEAAAGGLDVVSGLHERLNDRPSAVGRARQAGVELVDLRVPPPGIEVGSHRKRSGRRLLTVGTDCAVGKKYTALALTDALLRAGVQATFRATGQTGILLAGSGIAVDAVVADFLSGAAELISPDNDPRHWDVIEGQGSLFHPGYAGVSLGLLHGSQPDAFVVCHEANRGLSYEGHELPSIAECIAQTLVMGRMTNPGIRCVGISINTSRLSPSARIAYLGCLEEQMGLPCIDPMIEGCERIAGRLLDASVD